MINKEKKGIAKVYSAQNIGLDVFSVSVEIDISRGIPSFTIIGLPDKAVEEARDRVSTAIKHSDFKSPKQQNQKVVVSLAPGDLKKSGTIFDVPIAISYLYANGEISFDVSKKMFVGELSLNGKISGIPGVIPIISFAKENGFEEVYIPKDNEKEASLVDNIKIIPCDSLKNLISHIKGEKMIEPLAYEEEQDENKYIEFDYTFEDIKGHEEIKRVLTIAAAGGHNIALYGPPGTGKTLLVRSLRTLLPPLTKQDKIETTAIHSISNLRIKEIIKHPPFRSPHHTASYVSIIGGGQNLRPGEISLSHKGILFLDEFPEFDRRVVESLREPLEERNITITRAQGSATFPASCILGIAFNPCPCGNAGSDKPCKCSANARLNYQRKLTGPIIDRIDLWVRVDKISFDELSSKKDKRDLKETRYAKNIVNEARKVQRLRYANTNISTNSELNVKYIDNFIKLSPESEKTLKDLATKFNLSARGFHRVIKIARTIADIDRKKEIEPTHILEAIRYKSNTANIGN